MTKRFVDGLTYNTDTATRLAVAALEGDDGPIEETLYQTRGGAFFIHEVTTKEVWIERAQERQTRERSMILPQSAAEAQNWLLETADEVFHNPFEDPPEAAAESDRGATIYVRVPASLKQRVDEAAAGAKLSANSWAMRCVEHCVDGLPKELAGIWHIARGLVVPWSTDKYGEDAGLDSYKLRTAVEALEEIGELIESFAKKRFGTDDLSKIDGFEDADDLDLAERYQPYP